MSLLCFPLHRHQFQGRLSHAGAVIVTGLQISIFLVGQHQQSVSFPVVPANVPILCLVGLTGSRVHHWTGYCDSDCPLLQHLSTFGVVEWSQPPTWTSGIVRDSGSPKDYQGAFTEEGRINNSRHVPKLRATLPPVILWFIIRNIYVVFIPISGAELLKPLKFLGEESNQGVFCYVNEVTFGGTSGWG